MTGLEQTFYILAIIYMAVMFIILIAGVIAILAIKRKVDEIHRTVDEKLHSISNVFHMGEEVIDRVKRVVNRS